MSTPRESPERLPRDADASAHEEHPRTVRLEPGVAETLPADPRITIMPPRASSGSRDEAVLAQAREAATAPAAEGASSSGTVLALGRTLGQGGMGIVRVATQRALGREVAVKTVRDEMRGTKAAIELLREAWITGALEHPNVVPVYDLATDASGTPVLVLKRIEGEPWSSTMHDAEAIRARFGADDALEFNVRVLVQVCNAVHFAHSRGIVHRDIKPENVMLGRFGEVYLLDWGIAVSLEDDGSGRLPLAREARSLAGTPAYMAPEMLGGREPAIDARTDVYLLGAVLYELATGLPPHVAPDVFEHDPRVQRSIQGRDALTSLGHEPPPPVLSLLARLATRDPPMPPFLPTGLRAVLTKALARAPRDRYESAEALRIELERFLRHRGASMLADEATKRRDELAQAIDAARALLRDRAGGDAARERDDDEARSMARDRVHRLLGECRFGFRSALREWPDEPRAREGLRDALERVAAFEIARRDLGAADAICAEIDRGPSEPLREALEALRAERAKEHSRREALEHLGQQMDLSVGQRTRVLVSVVMGALWVGVPIVSGLLRVELTAGNMAATGLVYLLVFAALFVWGRESMTRTSVNRRLAVTIALAAVTQVELALLAHHLAIDLRWFEAAILLTWGIYAASVAIHIDRRMSFGAAGYFIGSVVCGLRPHWWRPVTALANATLVAAMWLAWGRDMPWRRDTTAPPRFSVGEHKREGRS